MTSGTVVYALVIGVLLSIAAVALEGVFRLRQWPTRWIWATSMIATLAAVALAPRPASLPLDVPMAGSATIAPAGPAIAPGAALLAWLDRAQVAAGGTMRDGMATLSQWVPSWLASAAVALWIVSALIGLSTLSMVHLRLRRARRAWPATELHGRRVRVAPSVGPAVVGLRQPEIVVPRWLLNRSGEEQRLVLAHEEEHVRARDHLLLGAAGVAVALMPWHPAAWWSLARLRLALELDCDARVLRGGTHARSYGEMLIDLAGQCSGFRVGATALADKTTHLERRLLAMRPITKRFTLLRVATLSAAAALSLAAACEARVPTSAEIETLDVAGAERVAQRSGLMTALHGGKAVEFYVNDVRVSAEQAHAIPPNDIATVNVEKGSAGNETSVIRIRTLATAANGMKYRTGAPVTISGGPVTMDRERTTFGPARLHEKIAVSDGTFSGIVLIDGTRADAAALHRLDPNDIAGVEVIKGAAAAAMSSDPAARNGIIRVTTRGVRKSG